MHTRPAAHALPQAPQWLVSTRRSTQTPTQDERPPSQRSPVSLGSASTASSLATSLRPEDPASRAPSTPASRSRSRSKSVMQPATSNAAASVAFQTTTRALTDMARTLPLVSTSNGCRSGPSVRCLHALNAPRARAIKDRAQESAKPMRSARQLVCPVHCWKVRSVLALGRRRGAAIARGTALAPCTAQATLRWDHGVATSNRGTEAKQGGARGLSSRRTRFTDALHTGTAKRAEARMAVALRPGHGLWDPARVDHDGLLATRHDHGAGARTLERERGAAKSRNERSTQSSVVLT